MFCRIAYEPGQSVLAQRECSAVQSRPEGSVERLPRHLAHPGSLVGTSLCAQDVLYALRGIPPMHMIRANVSSGRPAGHLTQPNAPNDRPPRSWVEPDAL